MRALSCWVASSRIQNATFTHTLIHTILIQFQIQFRYLNPWMPSTHTTLYSRLYCSSQSTSSSHASDPFTHVLAYLSSLAMTDLANDSTCSGQLLFMVVCATDRLNSPLASLGILLVSSEAPPPLIRRANLHRRPPACELASFPSEPPSLSLPLRLLSSLRRLPLDPSHHGYPIPHSRYPAVPSG